MTSNPVAKYIYRGQRRERGHRGHYPLAIQVGYVASLLVAIVLLVVAT